MTYDDWLQLSDEQRLSVHRDQWDVYRRDGYVIAITAAVRLAAQCGLPVFDVSIGTFHGGEYLLYLTVPDEHIPHLPAILEQTFEGFRVVWLPAGRIHLQPPASASLSGTWQHADGDSDAEFVVDGTCVPPRVEGRCLSDGEQLAISNVIGNDQALLFTSVVPSTGYTAEHIWVPGEDGTVSMRLTITEPWKKIC